MEAVRADATRANKKSLLETEVGLLKLASELASKEKCGPLNRGVKGVAVLQIAFSVYEYYQLYKLEKGSEAQRAENAAAKTLAEALASFIGGISVAHAGTLTDRYKEDFTSMFKEVSDAQARQFLEKDPRIRNAFLSALSEERGAQSQMCAALPELQESDSASRKQVPEKNRSECGDGTCRSSSTQSSPDVMKTK